MNEKQYIDFLIEEEITKEAREADEAYMAQAEEEFWANQPLPPYYEGPLTEVEVREFLQDTKDKEDDGIPY